MGYIPNCVQAHGNIYTHIPPHSGLLKIITNTGDNTSGGSTVSFHWNKICIFLLVHRETPEVSVFFQWDMYPSTKKRIISWWEPLGKSDSGLPYMNSYKGWKNRSAAWLAIKWSRHICLSTTNPVWDPWLHMSYFEP